MKIQSQSPLPSWKSGRVRPLTREGEISVSDNVVLSGQAHSFSKRLLRKMGEVALAVGIFSGLTCIPVVAQTVQHQQSQAAVDGEMSKALKDLKSGKDFVACVRFDSKCQTLYHSLPAPAQREYDEMPANVKSLLSNKLSGKTTIIPFVLKIDHRASFVKGEAFGQNAFDFVQGRIDKQVAAGSMTPAQGERSRRFLDVNRHMSQDQRGQMVDLIVRDATLAGK